MMKRGIAIIFALLSVHLAMAGTISYDVTASGTNFSITQTETKECDLSCSFALPNFQLPENETASQYSISNVTGQPNKIAFNSTGELTSTLPSDTIAIEYALPKEELKIAKMLTKTLNVGQNNIVVQLDNTGNVDLEDITVQISGDGVKTTDKTPVNIPKGKSDFATTVVSITTKGTIDIILKAYSKDKMLAQSIETVTVNGPEEKKVEAPKTVDANYAQQKTDELWKKLEESEKAYLTKKAGGYNVPDVTSTISEAKSEIKKLQLDSAELTEEAFNRRLGVAAKSLEEINLKLGLAAPKGIGDKLKDNMATIATTIGLIVSSLTAYGLAKTHIGQKKQ